MKTVSSPHQRAIVRASWCRQQPFSHGRRRSPSKVSDGDQAPSNDVDRTPHCTNCCCDCVCNDVDAYGVCRKCQTKRKCEACRRYLPDHCFQRDASMCEGYSGRRNNSRYNSWLIRRALDDTTAEISLPTSDENINLDVFVESRRQQISTILEEERILFVFTYARAQGSFAKSKVTFNALSPTSTLHPNSSAAPQISTSNPFGRLLTLKQITRERERFQPR